MTCKVCDGKGFIVVRTYVGPYTLDGYEETVEHCDTCAVYEDDETARTIAEGTA